MTKITTNPEEEMLLACGKSQECWDVVCDLIKHFAFAEPSHQITHSGINLVDPAKDSQDGMVCVEFSKFQQAIQMNTWKEACDGILGLRLCSSAYCCNSGALKFTLYVQSQNQDNNNEQTCSILETFERIAQEKEDILKRYIQDFHINVDPSNLHFVKRICMLWIGRSVFDESSTIPYNEDTCNLQLEVQADSTDIISSTAALLPMQFSDYTIRLDFQPYPITYNFLLFMSALVGIQSITLHCVEKQVSFQCQQRQLQNVFQSTKPRQKLTLWQRFCSKVVQGSTIAKYRSNRAERSNKIHTF